MGDVSLMFLATSLFCGILLPGDNATMISTALLAGSIAAFCLWLVVRRRIRLGMINALQILMLAELLLPLTTTTLPHFWGNYLSFAYAAVSFLCWSNLVRWHHRRWISGALAIYALILVGQIALRALDIVQQGIPLGLYKYYMVVPFGASNYLGGPLLILFFLFLCIRGREISSRLTWVVLATLLVGVFLIHSRATLVALVFTLLLYLLSRARLGRTRTGVVVWTGLAFLVTIGGFVGTLVLVKRYGGLMAGLNLLSSGRIDILEAASQAFLRRPWFGSGLGNTPPISILGYTFELWRTHNFLMDLLVFSGMVGTTIQCCVYLLAAHSMRIKAVLSPWAMGGFFSLIAILIDGLAEPGVFTYRVDVLLWMVIGVGYALSNTHGKPLAAQSIQEE
jgi:hypothetical protein